MGWFACFRVASRNQTYLRAAPVYVRNRMHEPAAAQKDMRWRMRPVWTPVPHSALSNPAWSWRPRYSTKESVPVDYFRSCNEVAFAAPNNSLQRAAELWTLGVRHGCSTVHGFYHSDSSTKQDFPLDTSVPAIRPDNYCILFVTSLRNFAPCNSHALCVDSALRGSSISAFGL